MLIGISNMQAINLQTYSFKVNIKNSQITVKYKLNKNELICQKEIDVFNSKYIRGLMRPKFDGGKILEYITSGNISVKDFINQGITKNDFFIIFAQLVECLKKLTWNEFDINKLVLDTEYIFYNQATREVQFIYQPIDGLKNGNNLYIFIYELINQAQSRISDNDGFLEALVDRIRTLPRLSPEILEKYIFMVYPQVYRFIKRAKKGDSQSLMTGRTYFDKKYDQEGVTDLDMRSQSESWNISASLNQADSETFLLDENNDFGTALLDENEGTALLVNHAPVYSYLIRVNTYEKIQINKPAFRIGKEKSYVDYFVASNNAVSRIHADIIVKDGHYFIKDNNSTNHTFINGTMIPTYQETEIFDGDSIMLANEPFEFHTV